MFAGADQIFESLEEMFAGAEQILVMILEKVLLLACGFKGDTFTGSFRLLEIACSSKTDSRIDVSKPSETW
jgi:hypothetical protein